MSETPPRDQEFQVLLASARACWPELLVADELFSSEQRSAMMATPSLASDIYLACGCAHGNATALQIFEQHVLAKVDGAVRRVVADSAFVDEVHQAVRERLFVGTPPRIASYAGRGPLTAWVRVTAVRLALNLRAKDRGKPETGESQLLGAASDAINPELAYLKQRYADEFHLAFKKAAEGLSPRQRNVLRLNFADGLNIEQIGAVYGVHRATTARWISAARERLFDLTRADLQTRLHVSNSEFESLVRLVRDDIDFRISQFFSATDF